MRDDRPGGPIRWRMHIAVSPDRVFAAFDSDEGRAAFWAESALEREGAIDFRFVDGSNLPPPNRRAAATARVGR